MLTSAKYYFMDPSVAQQFAESRRDGVRVSATTEKMRWPRGGGEDAARPVTIVECWWPK